jgi:hypothetical protein
MPAFEHDGSLLKESVHHSNAGRGAAPKETDPSREWIGGDGNLLDRESLQPQRAGIVHERHAQAAVHQHRDEIDPRQLEPLMRLNAGLAQITVDEHTIECRTFVDVFPNVDALIDWSSSSAFGNFLVGVTAADRAAVRQALARLLAPRAAPAGIRLERYLLFATARKPDLARPTP